MSRFSATTNSEAVVAAERSAIWAVLTDPVLLPKLTPLLKRIETEGDLWRWYLVGLTVLGVGISPVFTEEMTFDEGRRIDYTHAPPRGVTEQAGAEGSYDLSDIAGGTRLVIALKLHVELPLPRLAAPAVTRVMQATMQRMGDRFSVNLLRHLGVERQARTR
ncbi:SRPBCC family protein [Pseudonocardia sp. GCM10023141]|uniref:SRPBCC family protein n=1 Tax=Pseudonocardia sp. GCM10023141 TaxID=3252653 RepID=UPI0036129433